MNHKSIVRCGSVFMYALIAEGALAQEQEPPAAEAPPAAETPPVAEAPPAAEASASASLGGDSSASADASAPEAGDDTRFEPEPMQFELGIAAGFMLPADDHNLRSDVAAQHEYTIAPEVALRASFLPVKYLTWAPRLPDRPRTRRQRLKHRAIGQPAGDYRFRIRRRAPGSGSSGRR